MTMLRIPTQLTTLRECADPAGSYDIRAGNPPVDLVRDVFCVPPGAAGSCDVGIYRADGTLVEFAGNYRGGFGHDFLVQQNWKTTASLESSAQAPDHTYIYGGRLNPHFGHFLLSTLPRLWLLKQKNHPSVKIIVHEKQELEKWFKIEYFRSIMNALKIQKDDFFNCKKITHIDELIVPGMAFVEEHYSYGVFSEFCSLIGQTLTQDIDKSKDSVPVYISKSQMESGIWRFENEKLIEKTLRLNGIKIIYPEKIDLKDQIGLFIKHPLVIGSVSSGLHASLFSWNSPNIIGLSRGKNILSNFNMIDEIKHNFSRYFYATSEIRKENGNFSMKVYLENPSLVAEDLLRMIDANTDHRYKKLNAMQKKPTFRVQPHLGIAITTYNRPSYLKTLIERIEATTKENYTLIVCDDGSSEDTMDFLKSNNVIYITGENKGIAWNKNRGIFFLNEIANCTHIILLDDDVVIEKDGWEHEWINAIDRFGHVAHWFSDDLQPVLGGAGTADDPYITTLIQGSAIGLSRQAISYVGYMDNRFGKYGHEHTDYTMRFRRAGFGGVKKRDTNDNHDFFVAIKGDVTVHGEVTSNRPDDISESDRFFAISHTMETTRPPWRSHDEMCTFMVEINSACDRHGIAYIKNENGFSSEEYYALNPDVEDAAANAWQHFLNFGFRERRKFNSPSEMPTVLAIEQGAQNPERPTIHDDEAFAQHMRALGYQWPPPPL